MKFSFSPSLPLMYPSDLVSEDHNLALVHLLGHSFFLSKWLLPIPFSFSSKHESSVRAGTWASFGRYSRTHHTSDISYLICRPRPGPLLSRSAHNGLQPFCGETAHSPQSPVEFWGFPLTGLLDGWQLRYSLPYALLNHSFLVLIISDLLGFNWKKSLLLDRVSGK